MEIKAGLASAHESSTWAYQVEYFKSFQMTCEFDHDETDVKKVYMWILPNGEILRPGGEKTADHISIKNDGMILEVDRVDDELFGLYMCIVDIGSDIEVIKRGLNIDGPYYGPDHDKKLKHNAMIGGICAGAVLIVLVSIWIAHSLCCKSNKHVSKSKSLENIENGESTCDTCKIEQEGIENAAETKLDDVDNLEKIYDMADGIGQREIEIRDKVDPKTIDTYTAESSEYHTIMDVNSTSFSNDSGLEDDNKNQVSSSTLNGENEVSGENHVDQKSRINDVLNHKTGNTPGSQVSEVQETDAQNDNVTTQSVESMDSTKSESARDEVIYAVPIKNRSSDDKEQVFIVEGEVILEGSGATVVVTSSIPTPVITSGTEDSMADNILSGDKTATTQVDGTNMHQNNMFIDNVCVEQNEKLAVEVEDSVLAKYDTVLDHLRKSDHVSENSDREVETNLNVSTDGGVNDVTVQVVRM